MSGADEYGLFILDTVLMPGEERTLHIFEPRYRQLFADCVLESRPFVLVRDSEGTPESVGCTAEFTQLVQRLDDGRVVVVIRGLSPVKIGAPVGEHLYSAAICTPLPDITVETDTEREAQVVDLFRRLAKASTGEPREPTQMDDVPLSYRVAGGVRMDDEVLQTLLETRDENQRLEVLQVTLERMITDAEMAHEAARRASTNGAVPHT